VWLGSLLVYKQLKLDWSLSDMSTGLAPREIWSTWQPLHEQRPAKNSADGWEQKRDELLKN
jgi:hypothetical protein